MQGDGLVGAVGVVELRERAQVHVDLVSHALDVENGDATPQTANLWVQSWHILKRPGLAPLYVNRGNEETVIAACKSGGSVLGTHSGLIVSTPGTAGGLTSVVVNTSPPPLTSLNAP